MIDKKLALNTLFKSRKRLNVTRQGGLLKSPTLATRDGKENGKMVLLPLSKQAKEKTV